VPVSSLIFVVIVAIWAAYLLQHWVRRREDAAATRSVDGFTEAMRVLEKKPILPRTELREPRPDSYAVQPARDARPTVDVKRAVPAGTSRRHSPLVARRATEHQNVGAGHDAAPAEAYARHDDYADLAPNPVEVHSMAEHHHDHDSHDPRRDGRRPHERTAHEAPPQRRVSMAQRRLRAVLLLVALAWVPVSVWLAVTGVLLWVSVPFSVVTVLAVLVWLRAEAQSDRQRRQRPESRGSSGSRERESQAREAQAREPRSSGSRASASRVLETRTSAELVAQIDEVEAEPVILSSEVTQVIHHSAVTQVRTEHPVEHQVTAQDAIFDLEAVATGPVPVAATPAEELPPGSWSPVPVPKPTYVLKAKAEPRYTESGIPADVFDTPEFAEEAEELDERARFARRAASQ
jgi:membrane protein implicated in regulation of membrane protease activity